VTANVGTRAGSVESEQAAKRKRRVREGETRTRTPWVEVFQLMLYQKLGGVNLGGDQWAFPLKRGGEAKEK